MKKERNIIEENFKGFETLQIHAGQVPDSDTNSRAVPIYQTTAYTFDSADHAADLFALRDAGNIYTRLNNPTNDVLEKRIAALEGGSSALATASGASAILYSIMNIAQAGDEIVTGSQIYGGTYNLFKSILPRFGINVKFVNEDNPSEFKDAITENTKALYAETLGNPNGNVVDIEKLAEIAHRHNIMLIIDSTFTTPYLLRPFEYGANIVVHSATKFLGGHSTTMGGLLVDSGKFDFEKSGKYPDFTTPDESYHGIRYFQDCGKNAFITRCRVKVLRDTGACISPFNSFMLLQGIETLSLRMERHVKNALAVAEFLNNHPKAAWVNYPALEGNKYKALAEKYLPKGAGAIFTFGVKGGVAEGKKFINSLKLFSHVANVGDMKSLVTHPASTTHSLMNEEELRKGGVLPEAVRLSIGVESIDDILADLDNALGAI